MKELIAFLTENGIPFILDVDAGNFCTLRLPSPISLAVMPDDLEQMKETLRLFYNHRVPFEILGGGSNFFATTPLSVVLVTTNVKHPTFDSDTEITCDCGVRLPAFGTLVARMGLTGAEGLCGIPGTVGGAVVTNAGAYGNEIADCFVKGEIFDLSTGKIQIYDKADMCFSHRHSILADNPDLILLTATFGLHRGNYDEIVGKINENKEKRRASQPGKVSSAGSWFARPETGFASKMIDECGFKGHAVGDAVVSEKHAGFLVNRGNATAEDFLTLEAEIKETVKEKFGVTLTREVRTPRERRRKDEFCR